MQLCNSPKTLPEPQGIRCTPTRASDSCVFVESVKSVLYNVQLMPDVLHHAVDAAGVLQDVHTLGVGVVAYCEWATDGLGKLPVQTAMSTCIAMQ